MSVQGIAKRESEQSPGDLRNPFRFVVLFALLVSLPALGAAQAIQSLAVQPTSVTGGGALTGTVTLTAPAGSGGVSVTLTSDQPCVEVPSPVNIASGQTSASVTFTTSPVAETSYVALRATADGTTAFANVVVQPPRLKSLLVSPSSVFGGATINGTVNITAPAPAAGLTVYLGNSDSSTSVPASVTIPSGMTSTVFTVTTFPVWATVASKIYASTDTSEMAVGVNVVSPAVSGLKLSPASVTGGASSNGVVTLGSPAPPGFSVALTSSAPEALPPATVSFTGGSESASFIVATERVGSTLTAVIKAAAASGTKTTNLSLAPIRLISIVLSPAAVVGGVPFSGTVTLDWPAPAGGVEISLADHDPSVVVPGIVMVAAGTAATTFNASTVPVSTNTLSTVSASTGGATVTAKVEVLAPDFSLALSPSVVQPGATATGTVTLTAPAPTGGVQVSLSSATALAQVPATITIAAGSTKGSFTAQAAGVPASGSVVIMAKISGRSAGATLVVTGALANSAWPKFHGDVQDTGVGVGGGAGGAVKWQLHIPSADFIGSSPVLGSDGTVYIGASGVSDGGMYAINGKGAAIRWRFQTGGPIVSTPAVGANGLLYFGSNDFNFYALSAATGALKWKLETGGDVQSSPTIGSDGTVYFGSNDGNLFAVNGSTGAVKWTYFTGAFVRTSPSIGPDGTVYFGSRDTYVYAVDGATGVLRWRTKFRYGVEAAIAVGNDGNVYVGAEEDTIESLNAATGAVNWTFATSGQVVSTPAIGPKGTIYVGSADGYVYAINSTTGAQVWRFKTGGSVYSSPTVGLDGTVYVGSTDDNLYALNGTTGAMTWQLALGGVADPSAAIDANGILYMAGGDYVYAIK